MIGMLNKTLATKRPITTQGALGAVRSWSDSYHLEDIPCALQKQSANELGSTSNGVSSMVSRHKLWFEFGVDILKTDRVFIDGITFEVVSIDADVAGVAHHGSAELLEVSP